MKQDELFRQALQRQNDRSAGMRMPDDMERRVMDRIKPKKTSYRWLYAASIGAIAASVLLLLTFYFKGQNEDPKENTLTAQQTVQRNDSTKAGEKSSIGQEQLSYAGNEQGRLKADEQSSVNTSEKPVVVQDAPAKHEAAIKNPSAYNAKSAPVVAADQLNEYIARLEAEMEAVDDSVRSAHLEKLIAADVRLQQLVNRIVKDEADQALREIQKDSTANYINF